MKKNPFLKWLGLGMVLAAVLFIPLIGYVAVMPITIKQKATLTTALIVGGQIITWIGIALAGKEIVAQYKGYLKYLNPLNWRKKKNKI